MKVIKEVCVKDNGFIAAYFDIVDINGEQFDFFRFGLSKSKPNYTVACLPVTKSKNIILQKAYRHGPREYLWEVVKGMGENGVKPIDQCKAEMREEIGATAERIEYSGKLKYDMATFSVETFIAYGCEFSCATEHEKSEDIVQIKEFSLPEVKEMIKSGEICDVLTISLVGQYLVQ